MISLYNKAILGTSALANRLTDQVRSDGRSYTLRAEPQDEAYTWSNRNQLLAEWIPGVPLAVHEFAYDGVGRMTQARVFTLTTRFTYNGDGARHTVEVVGHGTTTYTLDYGRGKRVLAEETVSSTLLYLYGHDCLGQFEDTDAETIATSGYGLPQTRHCRFLTRL